MTRWNLILIVNEGSPTLGEAVNQRYQQIIHSLGDTRDSQVRVFVQKTKRNGDKGWVVTRHLWDKKTPLREMSVSTSPMSDTTFESLGDERYLSECITQIRSNGEWRADAELIWFLAHGSPEQIHTLGRGPVLNPGGTHPMHAQPPFGDINQDRSNKEWNANAERTGSRAPKSPDETGPEVLVPEPHHKIRFPSPLTEVETSHQLDHQTDATSNSDFDATDNVITINELAGAFPTDGSENRILFLEACEQGSIRLPLNLSGRCRYLVASPVKMDAKVTTAHMSWLKALAGTEPGATVPVAIVKALEHEPECWKQPRSDQPRSHWVHSVFAFDTTEFVRVVDAMEVIAKTDEARSLREKIALQVKESTLLGNQCDLAQVIDGVDSKSPLLLDLKSAIKAAVVDKFSWKHDGKPGPDVSGIRVLRNAPLPIGSGLSGRFYSAWDAIINTNRVKE